jgi:hypothetical protein
MGLAAAFSPGRAAGDGTFVPKANSVNAPSVSNITERHWLTDYRKGSFLRFALGRCPPNPAKA